jgi:hypothetical protein
VITKSALLRKFLSTSELRESDTGAGCFLFMTLVLVLSARKPCRSCDAVAVSFLRSVGMGVPADFIFGLALLVEVASA